jgi:hypothetical protein
MPGVFKAQEITKAPLALQCLRRLVLKTHIKEQKPAQSFKRLLSKGAAPFCKQRTGRVFRRTKFLA